MQWPAGGLHALAIVRLDAGWPSGVAYGRGQDPEQGAGLTRNGPIRRPGRPRFQSGAIRSGCRCGRFMMQRWQRFGLYRGGGSRVAAVVWVLAAEAWGAERATVRTLV